MSSLFGAFKFKSASPQEEDILERSITLYLVKSDAPKDIPRSGISFTTYMAFNLDLTLAH